MAEEKNDSSEKTEEPTQRRIREAVKRGQVAFSREVTNFLMLVVLALNIVWFAPFVMRRTAEVFYRFIESPHDIPMDDGNIQRVAASIVENFLLIISIPIMATVVVALLSSFLQNGFVVSAEPIMPKLEKISPIKGLKRMFSLRSVVDFIKGIIKISLVAIVGIIAVWPELSRIDRLPGYDLYEVLSLLSTLAFRMVLGACIIMAIVAVIDFLYQRYEYMKSLKMTKQELKEEFKQTEGDPVVKSRLRQIRLERARKRMMAEVPGADVVITNPTHYSIALKYDDATMTSPILVAKGLDEVALRIRELAKEHDIPIVENPPLARGLYDAVDLDEEMPLEFYQAVAEVIGYVYRLKGKLPPHKSAAM